MGSYERELCQFFLAWIPYGGPSPEQITFAFGISFTRAFEILGSLIEGPDQATMERADIELLALVRAHKSTITATRLKYVRRN